MSLSYQEYPQSCRFEGQKPDEKIVLLLRAHPVTNISWIIPAVLVFLLPFFLPSFIPLMGISFPTLPESFISAFLIINYLIVLVIVLEGFLFWYFNVNLITNKRLIDVDFHSILKGNIDHAPLDSVQEASGHVAGLLGIIFHYGDVFVQTAGATVSVDFHKVPNPNKVSDIILEQAKLFKGG